MTDRRLLFHEVLCDVLGSRNVYFQPPASVKMNYPAIVYSRDRIDNKHANNGVYLSQRRYSVTVIDKDPDSPIVGKVASLPTSNHNRHYEKDNLNHDVYTIFF
ncbi:MAG: hypothetical protein NC548_20425 [Lachnospiraceae bacterium]|nr:hypothetical protein [Lachnospiraceae bacterium]